MKAMINTFTTVSTHLLQYESQTIPVHLSLENQVLKSFTRMQTAPPNHPISTSIQRACQQVAGLTFRSNCKGTTVGKLGVLLGSCRRQLDDEEVDNNQTWFLKLKGKCVCV